MLPAECFRIKRSILKIINGRSEATSIIRHSTFFILHSAGTAGTNLETDGRTVPVAWLLFSG
jgi:hypothetical protein